MSDYTESDRWDWDRDDPRQYCHHGTFIGSWWGPDVLCSSCEFGDNDPSINEMIEIEKREIENIRLKERSVMAFIGDFYNDVVATLGTIQDDPINQVLSKNIMEFLNSNKSSIECRLENIQSIISLYEEFCDPDLGHDDNGVLYKKHRHEIREFLKEREWNVEAY